ncbi:hypothetical protein L228DRAFT_154874 [Xylona heveae TC161]|uniref:Secreted protein n=1 Tax=Xylona heveae (strain CBS 132557 / TC161) TaxID=1328760 RepID=A0A165FXN1_XYLHT|nr:hypothetical protein L228DRAFT_154874 [Xylona heveae TC161]KZF21509.1 hypothetical protein L228DRAFT_154874 [Xylona heveae TC161]
MVFLPILYVLFFFFLAIVLWSEGNALCYCYPNTRPNICPGASTISGRKRKFMSTLILVCCCSGTCPWNAVEAGVGVRSEQLNYAGGFRTSTCTIHVSFGSSSWALVMAWPPVWWLVSSSRAINLAG